MKTQRADLAIIGAGIVGLAHAYAAARRGLSVVVFERTAPAVGASVRNFGLVWPVGQPEGPRHDRAMRSREIWGEVAAAARLHFAATGSLHLAYAADEWAVLEEFGASALGQAHGRALLLPAETLARSGAVNPAGLRGALWSATEATVDPCQAIRSLPAWLNEAHRVSFQFSTTVRRIELPSIETTSGTWIVDRAIVCSGQDFETLFPETFAAAPITRCKLQMLRTPPQPDRWKLGPALCAGLTLTHYDSFKDCAALALLEARVALEMPFLVEHGIHVLLSQTANGALTIGDSHHYRLTVDPFDREDINAAILGYLRKFAVVPTFAIEERWHGVYPKMKNGASELVAEVAPGVWVVNGLGGAGMTLSFGLAEEVLAKMF
jgi:FAD dependent oxidoreductase TIGR03364